MELQRNGAIGKDKCYCVQFSYFLKKETKLYFFTAFHKENVNGPSFVMLILNALILW